MPAFVRLFGFLTKYRRRTAFFFLSIFGNVGFSLVIPWITKQVVDIGLSSGDARLLGTLAFAVVAFTFFRGISAFGQTYLGEYISQRVAYDLRNAIYDRIQRLSFSFHDKSQTGQLMSRATADVEAVRVFFNQGIAIMTTTVVLLSGVLIILINMNQRLAIITLVFVPISAISALKIGSYVRPIWTAIQQQNAVLTTYLQESISGIRVVKSFAREAHQEAGFEAVSRTLNELNVRAARLQAFNMPLLTTIVGIATATSIWVGGRDVIEGSLTIGDLFAYVGYLALLTAPVRRLGFMVNMFARVVAAGGRVFDLLDTESEVQERPEAIDLTNVQGLVRFENVSFGYEKESPLLRDIDIEARPGEVVALLGATGSGKSTITLLLPRFYDVTAGQITIDGLDIRDITLRSLRREVGIVLQDSFLFSATIRDNVAYGGSDYTDEEIFRAARIAGAHDFIMSFPDGYDTWVGERGVTLSGGQKQRLAIARTLLLDPRILILDDSTSSVDTETEFQIQQSLQELMRGRTTFVIAQRLRTVRDASKILVLDKGEIVERGTHEELLRGSGMYREIYDLQLRDQEDLEREIVRTNARRRDAENEPVEVLR